MVAPPGPTHWFGAVTVVNYYSPSLFTARFCYRVSLFYRVMNHLISSYSNSTLCVCVRACVYKGYTKTIITGRVTVHNNLGFMLHYRIYWSTCVKKLHRCVPLAGYRTSAQLRTEKRCYTEIHIKAKGVEYERLKFTSSKEQELFD